MHIKKIRAPTDEPATWTVQIRLRVAGYQLPEVDITAALGLGLIAVFTYFLAIQDTLVR